MRAYRFFDTFHGDSARAWLLTIVRRTWYTEWRRRAQAREAAVLAEADGDPDAAETDGWDVGADPQALLIRAEDARCVHDALARLPAEYREVLVLREMEELSYREIAAIADVPLGTVMSRLARARRRLATLLAAQRGGAHTGAPVATVEAKPEAGDELDHVRPLLDADLDRELSPSDALRVGRHLDDCAECRRVRATLASAGRAVRQAGYHRAPETLRAPSSAGCRLSRGRRPSRGGPGGARAGSACAARCHGRARARPRVRRARRGLAGRSGGGRGGGRDRARRAPGTTRPHGSTNWSRAMCAPGCPGATST